MLYIILLLTLFVILFALEFFIPSGGVIGIIAVAVLIAAVVIAFMDSVQMGLGVLIFAMLLVPTAFGVMIRVWPKTPMGKTMLGPPMVEQKRAIYAEYLNQVGVAKSNLLPSGQIEVDGRRLDAVSTGVPIDRGTVVEIVSIDGNRIHVRPTDRALPGKETQPEASLPTLETPVESLGLDDFSDPLA